MSVSGPLFFPPSSPSPSLPPLLPDCYFSWRRAWTALGLDVVPSANMGLCIIKRHMWSPTETHIMRGLREVRCLVFCGEGSA